MLATVHAGRGLGLQLRALQAGFLFLSVALAPGAVFAGHHRWVISEVFTDATGKIQFIEFESAFDGDAEVGPFTITSGSASLPLGDNLPSASTGYARLLVATIGFAALPGAPTPDYTLPDDFINPAGDTLTYTGTDTLVLGPLPTDGTTSFDRASGAERLNTPTNLAGDMGSIDASSRASAAAPLPIAGLILMIGLMMSIAARVLGPRRRVEV